MPDLTIIFLFLILVASSVIEIFVFGLENFEREPTSSPVTRKTKATPWLTFSTTRILTSYLNLKNTFG